MRSRIVIAAATTVLIALIVAAVSFWPRNAAQGTQDSPEAVAEQPLLLLSAASASLDGAPALALSFSIPVEDDASFDDYIKVFEMPPNNKVTVTEENNESGADDEEGGSQNGASANADKSMVSTAAADVRIDGGKAVDGAWVQGKNPRQLFFPHIRSRTRYVIQVKDGLPAVNGKTLQKNASYSVQSAAIAPAYYFASNGMVLPARQNGGLPVVTVNVPEVDIQFMRVRPDQLPRFLDQVTAAAPAPKEEKGDLSTVGDGEEENEYSNYYDTNKRLHGAVSNYELDRLHKLSDSVFQGRFLTEQQSDKQSVTYIPVEDVKELQEPGVYVAIMSQPGRFRYEYQTTYFYVSDLGLQLRRFSPAADAFVSSLKSGKALSGVEISWLDSSGKTLLQGKTDGDGHAAFNEQPRGAAVLMARQGDQVSMLVLKEPALDLSEYTITGLPYKPVRLFAWAGRDLYRPGERFTLSVQARNADGKPVPAQPLQATLKRPDGRSQLVSMWKGDARFPGYYQKDIELPADSPTGFWTLELRTDPASKQPASVFRFGVEEFLPERMKMDLAVPEQIAVDAGTLDVAVRGTYLYGAPAAGNRLLGVAQFERKVNPLAATYAGFEFGDVNEKADNSRVDLEEQVLDDEGNGTLSVNLAGARGHKSPFTVRTTVSLLESGGRPVIRTVERVLWPASTLIGIRPLFEGSYAREESPADFEVVRVNQQGVMQAAANLPVRLFREDRNWYWRFDDQSGWNSGYTEAQELVRTTSLTLAKGARGKLRLPVKYGRYRVEIDDPQTRQTLVYRFYAGWNAGDSEQQGNRPDRVTLKLDKAAYKAGDTAVLTIKPPHAGEALITVEGDRVNWVKRVSISGDSETVNIPVDKDWSRHDLYINVVVLRPGSLGDQVTPARALGVLALPLDRSEQKLKIDLQAPVKARSASTVKVKVRVPQAAGHKAMVTLSAVDVGILNISRYATPDPWQFFFGQLRYGADLHDIYGRLIEKMAGARGKLKYGGDTTPKATQDLPKKVLLVDLFSGPVALNAQGEAEITLKLPDFNGTLRLMAVASSDERFGSADAEMTVVAPIIAELSMPRFLSFGDVSMLALDVQNMSGSAEALTISMGSSNGLRINTPSRTLALKNGEKQVLRFEVTALPVPGLHPLTITVKGNKTQMTRRYALQVEPTTPYQTQSVLKVLAPGETVDLKSATLAGLHPQSVTAHVVISNQPPLDVRSAIQGLLRYPYGCAEQTTSSAYPFVFVDEAASRDFGLPVYSRARRADILEKAIARLGAMQAPNGGFSLWGEHSQYDYWLASYVTSFLQDARAQGFTVPDAMYTKAMDFLLREMQAGIAQLPPELPAPGSDAASRYWQSALQYDNRRFEALSFGAYVLARERRAPLGTLRQLFEQRTRARSGLSLVQLGVALRLMGDKPKSDVALKAGVALRRDSAYWWWSYDYGTVLRDAALSWVLLDRHQVSEVSRHQLLTDLIGQMEGKRYLSTQEQMALFLVGSQMRSAPAGAARQAELTRDGKQLPLRHKGSLFQELAQASLNGPLTLTNTDQRPLYARLTFSGNLIAAPANRGDIVKLERTYYSSSGVALGNGPLHVGDTIIVRLSASAGPSMGTAMLVDRIPAGIEIENMNLIQGAALDSIRINGIDPVEAMSDRRIKHVEFRDDRFVAAISLGWYQNVNLFYRARVTAPGSYVIPPLVVDDMYRPDLNGVLNSERRLVVVNAGAVATAPAPAGAASAATATVASAPVAAPVAAAR